MYSIDYFFSNEIVPNTSEKASIRLGHLHISETHCKTGIVINETDLLHSIVKGPMYGTSPFILLLVVMGHSQNSNDIKILADVEL